MKNGINFERVQDGGHQERNKRSGTENVAGIVGLGKAIEVADNRIYEYNRYLLNLRNYFIEKVIRKIENVKINGDLNRRLPGHISISFKDKDSQEILLALDKRGICASGGSACSSGENTPSHVLLAIGLPREWLNGTIRLTLGEENTRNEIDYVVNSLETIIKNCD